MGAKSKEATHWPTASELRKIADGVDRLVEVLEQYAPIPGEPAKYINDKFSQAASTAHSRISSRNLRLWNLVNSDGNDPDRCRDIWNSGLPEDEREALLTVARITQELLGLYGTGQSASFEPCYLWSPRPLS